MKLRNIIIGILLTLSAICIALFICYQTLSSPVDKNSNASIEVVIPSGMNTKNIASLLEKKELIRNEMFFRIYLRVNHISSLKASTYLLKKSMSLEEIIKTISKGNSYNPDVIKMTFKEGENFTDYAKTIAKHTNHTYEEVVAQGTDQNYIKGLLEQYWFLSEDILGPNIYYPLEGYLSPNTYEFKNADVSLEEIFKVLLDHREEELTKLKSKATTYSIHEYMTLASMVELEGTNQENRKMIAGIFYNRLNKKMNLGSDVTTYYALQYPMTSDLTTAQFNTRNPYNTRGPGMLGKLPIGPICNPSLESIEASMVPTSSDYLYFVADKHGEVFYTKTNDEHLQKVQEIKDKGDWIW